MMEEELLAERAAVKVEVDFGGGDRLVAEHLLDGPEVGAPLQEMGGEGMAEGVRADSLGDAGGRSQVADDVENHDATQGTAAPVQKQYVGAVALYVKLCPLRKIQLDELH